MLGEGDTTKGGEDGGGRGGLLGVEEKEKKILMKLQNGLIDFCGCMLQWRAAV